MEIVPDKPGSMARATNVISVNRVILGIIMNTKQGGIMLNKMGRSLFICKILGLFLFIFQIASVKASDLAISGLDVAALAGDKLQIQLEMNGAAVDT